MATRLGELTINRPKSLVEIHNKPFLAYQLELLKANGVSDIVLCIGHLGTQIQETFGDGRKYGVHLRYSIEDKLLGTAGALKNAEALLADRFFVLYGDSYVFLDFQKIMSWYQSQNKLALCTVYKNENQYDKSNMVINGNMVILYSKTETSEDMKYIDYGASIFNKEVLNLIPANRPYALEDVTTGLIEMKQLLAFEVKDRFYEIGSAQGLQDFRNFAKRTLNQ
jgi:NDP-sugar pyrophosphorylase family protein